MFLFFFFSKQKTAYELRISDWSSDVCSSDLAGGGRPATRIPATISASPATWNRCSASPRNSIASPAPISGITFIYCPVAADPISSTPRLKRSEEHTSELQSLMRISYAVFYLHKKKQTPQQEYIHTIK